MSKKNDAFNIKILKKLNGFIEPISKASLNFYFFEYR